MPRTSHCLRSLLLVAWLAVIRGSPAEDVAGNVIMADFEGRDYGQWTARGDAFGSGPAQGTLPNQMAVDGFLGTGLASSFHGGDRSTGTLTSPALKIERRYLQFLIGGGRHPGETCLDLLVDDRVVRTATGPNDQPGGSEHLDWEQWEVSDLLGKTVTLRIVDQATGGWGHISVDQILQTNRRLPSWVTNAQRSDFLVEHRFLFLPVKNGASKRLFTLLVDDRVERQFEIELADTEPDWWAFAEVAQLRGKRVRFQVDKLKEDSKALTAIHGGDELEGKEAVYHERLRPQFHFTSRRGWNNDPNGLVYLEGEYHLFYQHNPYGWSWGNMHWGHAVSRDLIHWKELGEALYPDELGTMFSGSAIIDAQNTAGFRKGQEKPIVCFYTAAGGTSPSSKDRPFSQCLAYSLDRGRTWTKFEGNPVLPHVADQNRDPKVIWYAPEKKWIMALYLAGSDYGLFSSKDLKQWEKMSQVSIPGTSECPEFFEIAVRGTSEKRWVFYGGNGRYLVGRFDGRVFAPESGPTPLHYGNSFYASQTYSDVPPEDGRRILIPWGTMATPGMPFNQMMGVPVELTLELTEAGPRVLAQPVRELETLRRKSGRITPQNIEGPISIDAGGELLDITASIEPGTADVITVFVRGVPLTYDAKKRTISWQDKSGPLSPVAGVIQLRILVDRTSIDLFGNNGQLYMPIGVIVPSEDKSFRIQAQGSGARLVSGEVHQLASAWE